jgi:transposase-like protein
MASVVLPPGFAEMRRLLEGRMGQRGKREFIQILRLMEVAPMATLAFYDFPAEHWKHLRTTNPIESTFATIRHRTVRSKGCLSNKTALALIFKLAQAAEKSWRRLDGHHHLPKVIREVTFTDGVEVVSRQAQAVAA